MTLSPVPREPEAADSLTAEQRLVAEAIAAGMTRAQAAEAAGCSVRTVYRYLGGRDFRKHVARLAEQHVQEAASVYKANARALAEEHIALAKGKKPKHSQQLDAVKSAVDRAGLSPRQAPQRFVVGAEAALPDGATFRILVGFPPGEQPVGAPTREPVPEEDD